MKKLLFALCMAMAPATLLALPIGNPWEASLHTKGVFWDDHCTYDWDQCSGCFDALSFRLGYYGDFVFDRHLRVDRKGDHSTIHDTKISTNAIYLALNFCNRIDLFGTLGASQIGISTPSKVFGNTLAPPLDNLFVDVDSETTFSWSMGVRGTLLEWGCLGIGAEAHYFRSRSRLNSAHSPDFDTFYFVNEERPIYHEWQVGLGAAYRINIACGTALIPYAGIKWSDCQFTSDNAQADLGFDITIFDLENNRKWGYAFGMTLLGCDKASITVEGRFRDEKALYVNGQFRF